MTTVGSGKYTYELIQDWAHLPPGETFGRISGLAADSQDRVFAFQQKDPPMLIFDREGNLLSSWGNRAFVRAHYIHIANDIAYLTDTDDSVAMVYTLDGKPLQVLGQRGVHSDTGTELYGDLVPCGGGPFNHPTRMVPGPTGDLFVSDGERNCRVHRFTKNGELIASWGSLARRVASSIYPTASWWTRMGRSMCATVRMPWCKSSHPRANTSPVGPICAHPPISQSTMTAYITSLSCRSTMPTATMATRPRWGPAAPSSTRRAGISPARAPRPS